MPELEALEQRGYFSRGEIRMIVRKRQDFEYALKRMAAIKADYLRCAFPAAPLCPFGLDASAGGANVSE